MYTLYGMTGSCSLAVHILLNELNQPVTLIDNRVPAGQPKPAALLAVNPRGNVPVLVEGDFVMREGGAILNYLMDKHNSPMLPKDGPARGRALEWLAFANATMHPAYSRVFFLMAQAESGGRDEALKRSYAAIDKLWADVDAELANKKFIGGDSISAADILLSVIANWGQATFAKNLTFGANVKRMLKEVSSRPAYQKALADEGVEYKAAA